jgi:hypothetical protein
MVQAGFLGVLLVLLAGAEAPRPVVEVTNFSRTSTYGEVVDFVQAVARGSEVVAVTTLATSAEGRPVPLVILSQERVRTPEERRATGKPAVLVMANIHAGEVEGKEACQMLIRDVALGPLGYLLEHQVVLVVPIFNADGNDKFGANRHDNGPELAGVRHNGQFLDLNRDYTKLESPEVRGLVRLFASWDPVVVVDMHTTNGSYHREPVTYTTGINPNGARALSDYMWGTFFPKVASALEREGWSSVPYGNFADPLEPSTGWENDAVEVRYGSNYVALRNRLAILDENYAYADFKTRVLASYAFVREILHFTNERATELAALVQRVDGETRDGYRGERFVSSWQLEPLMEVTVRSFEFEKKPTTPEERARLPWLGPFRLEPTSTQRDYRLPYLARATPTTTVPLPAGYLLLPGFREAVEVLLAHGVGVERLGEPFSGRVERLAMEAVETARNIVQGHVAVTVKGEWVAAEEQVPAGSLFVDMRQPLARLVPVLLEPSSSDGLASWGFFNRALVRQWSREPGIYPVLRVSSRPAVAMEVLQGVER